MRKTDAVDIQALERRVNAILLQRYLNGEFTGKADLSYPLWSERNLPKEQQTKRLWEDAPAPNWLFQR